MFHVKRNHIYINKRKTFLCRVFHYFRRALNVILIHLMSHRTSFFPVFWRVNSVINMPKIELQLKNELQLAIVEQIGSKLKTVQKQPEIKPISF